MTTDAGTIESGLRYTEETGRLNRSLPVRDCFLWQEGSDEPVSGLNLVSFRQRFGSLSIPSEGFGGVETVRQFRRQGYMSELMKKALEGVKKRVKVVFVSDAIEEVYEKLGFVNCYAEAYLVLQVRNVEHSVDRSVTAAGRIRAYSPADLPAMVSLYNKAHARRPWTHERAADWNRLLEARTWRPGSEVIILEWDDGLAGYAIMTEQRYGTFVSPFIVDELTARDLAAARALLAEVATRCWQVRFSEFWVREPIDSLVGKAAQELGCEYHQTFPPSGGMMGAILDRPGLLQLLEPELRRRLSGDRLLTEHERAFKGLCRGEIVTDEHALLRLLLGYWSLNDAVTHGATVTEEFELLCNAWFPGGGSQVLPRTYAHVLDRY